MRILKEQNNMNTIKRSSKILNTHVRGAILSNEHKEYSIFDVVAHFSDKPIDQILEEQKKVRDSWR